MYGELDFPKRTFPQRSLDSVVAKALAGSSTSGEVI